MSGSTPRCLSPNERTRAAARRLDPGIASLEGYQTFRVTCTGATPSADDPRLARKAQVLSKVISPGHFHDRAVLDLGANNGFFAFLSLQAGARSAMAVDIDAASIDNINEACTHLGIDGLTAVQSSVADWETPADCVFALALSHWLCGCTAGFTRLADVVRRLDQLTAYLLITEFVDADDPAVLDFGHLRWQGAPPTDYSRDTFESALRRSFRRVWRVGDLSSTRSIYAAMRTPGQIDLRCPLPIPVPGAVALSAHALATKERAPVWSSVHQVGPTVVKQTTGDLAAHEAAILRRLDGVPNVPRLIAASSRDGVSSFSATKMAGEPLLHWAARHGHDVDRSTRLVTGCLDLLDALASRNVHHRDIHVDNLLVGPNDEPVLLDFGWAVAPGLAIDAPPGLRFLRDARATANATPEPCDLRDMGLAVGRALAGASPLLATYLRVWTDVEGRVGDLSLLSRLWETMVEPVASVDHLPELVAALLALPDANGLSADATTPAAPGGATASSQPGVGVVRCLLHIAGVLRTSGLPGPARDVVRAVSDRIEPASDGWLHAVYLDASASEALGEIEAARRLFDVVRCHSRDPLAHPVSGAAAFRLARLAVAAGDAAGARTLLEECLARVPEHGAARQLLMTLNGAVDDFSHDARRAVGPSPPAGS